MDDEIPCLECEGYSYEVTSDKIENNLGDWIMLTCPNCGDEIAQAVK